MRLEFHPAVQRDFNEALDHYEREGGLHLADRFEGEFRAYLEAVWMAPRRFSFYLKSAMRSGDAGGLLIQSGRGLPHSITLRVRRFMPKGGLGVGGGALSGSYPAFSDN